MALLAGCGHTTAAGEPTPVGPATSLQPPAASAGTNSLAARVVKASCGTQVPAAVTAVVPGATAVYVPKYALGSDCQWSSADYAHRVIAYAITSMPYGNWQKMQALTGQTTVAGYAAVRGQTDGNCVILVNVHNVAFEVDLRGIGDPTCQTTTTLAGHLLAGTS
ncbi:MAG TPA: DUF3558 family protein [Pseudonocardiaceae bacterium]|nr:DUF3558 family protein [Pseudonocardiaceae bacterium]